MEIKTRLTAMVGDLLRDLDNAGWAFDFVQEVTPEDCKEEGPWQYNVNGAFTVEYEGGTFDVFKDEDHVASYDGITFTCTRFKLGDWVDGVASVHGLLLAEQYDWERARRQHSEWATDILGPIQ